MVTSPTKPQVSIILPCRNEARGIESCIASVLAQSPPPGGFEVIVADGMSDDGTRVILDMLEEQFGVRSSVSGVEPPEVNAPVLNSPGHSSLSASDGERAGVRCNTQLPISSFQPPASRFLLRVTDNPGRIVSTGLNAAIRAAHGDIIIRLDAHTQYAPDYLCRCVEVLEKTKADNVGGPWTARGNSPLSMSIAAAFQSPFAVGGARSHNPEHEGEVDSVYLGCWRRNIFERFGYFDEELVRNQDDEHNLRIIRGGGKIWQSPKIKSWYQPRGSLAALFKQYMQYGYWKVRVIQKHKLPASWRHLVPGAFVLTLLGLFLLSAFTFLASHLFPLFNFSFQLSTFSFGILDFCWLLSAFCFLFTLSVYASAVLVASVMTAAKAGWKLLPLLPLVFPCYHLGYGYGFLCGIWDFVIRRKGAQQSFAALTR